MARLCRANLARDMNQFGIGACYRSWRVVHLGGVGQVQDFEVFRHCARELARPKGDAYGRKIREKNCEEWRRPVPIVILEKRPGLKLFQTKGDENWLLPLRPWLSCRYFSTCDSDSGELQVEPEVLCYRAAGQDRCRIAKGSKSPVAGHIRIQVGERPSEGKVERPRHPYRVISLSSQFAERCLFEVYGKAYQTGTRSLTQIGQRMHRYYRV